MIRQKTGLFHVKKIPTYLSSQRKNMMDNLVLLETERKGGKHLLLRSHRGSAQKHPLIITGCRGNREIQGFTQWHLAGGKDCHLHSSIPNIF